MISLHRYKNIVSLYHSEHRGFIRFPAIPQKKREPVIFDANKYKTHINTVKRLYERDIKEGKDLDDIIQVITLSTSMPVMAAVLWIQCLYGSTDEIERKIKTFSEYYHYDDVLPLTYVAEESK